MNTSTGKMQTTYLAQVVLLLFVLTPVSLVAQGQDQVVLKDDSSHRGTVVKETVSKIVLKGKEGARNEYNVENVKQVVYADMSKQLSEARRALQENSLNEAIDNGQRALRQVEAGSLRKALHLPKALYYLGHAHFLKGNFDQARSHLERYFQDVPNSRNYYKAARVLLLSRVYKYIRDRSSEDDDRGDKVYSEVRNRLSTLRDQAREFDANQQLMDRLRLLGAMVREEIGRPRAAETLYNEMEDSDVDSVARAASVGGARCLVRVGEFDNAIDQLEDLSEDHEGDRFISAALLNARGSKRLSEWKKGDQKSPDKLRGALMKFVRVGAVHFPGPRDPSIEHRQALKKAAECYRLLAKHADEGTSYYNNQALKTYNELIDVFPSTPESIHAKKQKKTLKKE